ncbi:mevalonate kinase-like, partial [Octopus sinensis]|uniref:Mevalonate kinase-like n=1 Tax=Octopus sinensis TaxID=2607531 RepID=A0A7E6EIP5_9MOLL
LPINGEICSSDLDIINKWTFLCECLAHGTPSGVDNTVSVYGGFVSYKAGSVSTFSTFLTKNNNFRETKLMIMIVNTKIPRSTKNLVNGVRNLYENIENVLNAMGEISEKAWRCLGEDLCEQTVKELMRMAHASLNLLGVSCDELDFVVSQARRYGFSAKLTGAGGGGCAIVLIPEGLLDKIFEDVDEKEFVRFRESLPQDYKCYDVTLGSRGLTLDRME